MDYKNSLNLPKTAFPMKADLLTREPERLKRWYEENLYSKIMDSRKDAPRYILHDGPPFANGDVHVGTALNKILKDIIIRHKTLMGFNAPYVPGWDCHGLPIEYKVMQDVRKKNKNEAEITAATIRKECEAYARKYIDIQREQFKRLGVLGDWDNPYLTFLPELEAAELRLLADIVEKGFVYRGKKPVYWSIPCRTALAEAEVEYAEHVSPSIFVKFPVMGHKNIFVIIWTTTPWTLPANLAIAYNPKLDYLEILVGQETYLVAVELLNQVAEKCGWNNYQIIHTVQGEALSQLICRHPFCKRESKLYAADFVESSTGTGFVHIAPGHGMEDYVLGLQNGLPVYSPIDDAGCLIHTDDLPIEQQIPSSLLGLSVLEKQGQSAANQGVIELLRQQNQLLAQESYSHSYPHCWRSKTPVIFRAMDQWFIKIDHEEFRQKALEVISTEVSWIPQWGRNRIEGAVQSRPDWCISRQRTWGVPIPAFYDNNATPILEPSIIRSIADLVEKDGSNVWFEKTAEELWEAVRPAQWDRPEAVAKGSDTLDVWIDSGSTSRSVLMQREELNHLPDQKQPTWVSDMYLEGSDQHRGWFQSSLLLSLAGNGHAPYRTVLTHGFMVDADREKISKSKQSGYQKPQTSDAYIKQYGADVLRLWVASQDFRNDIVVSEERINKVGETYRAIRNALRYQLSNLQDFDPVEHKIPFEKLTALDRWILDAFSVMEKEVINAYKHSEFHQVYQKISQFISMELSAIYHDAIKDRMYTDKRDSIRRRSTQTTLHHMLTQLCILLSPILVFTADEAWEYIPGNEEKGSVHLACYKPSNHSLSPEEKSLWTLLFQLRTPALAELERARQAKTIGKSLEGKMTISAHPSLLPLQSEEQELLRELLNLSQLTVTPRPDVPESLESAVFQTAPADGTKCERCWHYEVSVGENIHHPTLCSRCLQAVL
jgi:isoleucyl-tRNA synthetase